MSKSAPAKADIKTELTFKTVENLKTAPSAYNEFLKAATNYQKQAQKLAEAGRILADSLVRVSQLHSGDLGQGIGRLADVVRATEIRRDQTSRCMGEDLINGLIRMQKPDEAEIAAFRSDYEKARNTIKSQILKLEANTKKAGKTKGNPQVLQQSIQQLNDKIKEAENIKADKLRQILLIERKKYATFLNMWISTLNSTIDHHNDGAKFKENIAYWSGLASSGAILPAESEDLIRNQERTFVSIQGSGEYDSSYGSSWESSSYDTGATSYDNNSYDTGYSTGGYNSYDQPQTNYGGYSGGSSYGLGTCTALYDYNGQQAEDLSFYAGEVITITQEDDGSGWLRGELNGASGIFPSSYVQR